MSPGLKFTAFLFLLVIGAPITLGLVIGLIALALSWVVWPLLVCLAAVKYLFF